MISIRFSFAKYSLTPPPPPRQTNRRHTPGPYWSPLIRTRKSTVSQRLVCNSWTRAPRSTAYPTVCRKCSPTQAYVSKYHGQKLGALEPHVFALAEAAYRHLRDNNQNQVCTCKEHFKGHLYPFVCYIRNTLYYAHTIRTSTHFLRHMISKTFCFIHIVFVVIQ